MAKYLVTSDSYFRPFSYEELVKPIAHMQEVHNATQDAYDQLSMETSALKNYITDKPDDAQAKAMYDAYTSKLESLQNNLWENGVSSKTRQDLSAARKGYFSDITRLSNAIKTRQERSKAFWDMKHNHPDLITSDDPGLSGLDNYLNDANYGQNFYAYSGESFMKEVATDAGARANEMLRDPQIVKDPRLVGYLTRITREGFTSEEVQNAGAAVKLALSGDTSGLQNLDEASSILANVLMSHIESSGAVGQVNEKELNRLYDYGMAGLSASIGKKKIDDLKDLQWQEAMERSRFAWQQQYKAAEAAAKAKEKEKQSIKLEDTNSHMVTGPNAKRTNRRLRRRGYGNTATKLVIGPNGEEVHNAAEASEVVYGGDIRRRAYEQLGFDVGRTPGKNSTNNFLQGYTTIQDADGNDVNVRTRYNPHANGGKGAVEYSYSGQEGTWKPSPGLTKYYNDARSAYGRNRDSYKDTELWKMADIDPDKQYKDYDRYRVSFDTPLTDFFSAAMSQPENSTRLLSETYVARRGTDSGKYVQKVSDMLSNGIYFKEGSNDAQRHPNRRSFKGTSDYVHEMTDYGTLKRNAIKNPDNVFKFSSDGKITNISEVKITPDSILDMIDNGRHGNGYFVVKLDDNRQYAMSVDMMDSDVVNNIFAYGRYKLSKIMEDEYLSEDAYDQYVEEVVKEVSYRLKDALGYALNTVSQGGDSKENIN